jgi:hypothetical protein
MCYVFLKVLVSKMDLAECTIVQMGKAIKNVAHSLAPAFL